MPQAPPWQEGARPLAGADSLPSAADVAVVGGGLAGVAVARGLARAGASVVLFDARPDFGLSMSGRALGLAAAGLAEHPHRLVAAVGRERAREIYGFSMENLDLLRETGRLEPTGSLAVAATPDEPAEIEASCEALAALGLPVELWSAERVAQALHAEGFGPGRFVPGDGQVDPRALLETLVEQGRAAGARLLPWHAVGALVARVGGYRLLLGDVSLDADVVVFAGSWELVGLDPWFGDKLLPVREEHLALALARPPSLPGTAMHGWCAWRPWQGQVLASGCRWATPEQGGGETDEHAFDPRVQERLAGFVRRHFPGAGPVLRRWAGIMGFTCDGLPIVGPLPGRAQLLACCGWNGRPISLALRGAQAVVDGLIEGRAPGVPALLSPRRFT